MPAYPHALRVDGSASAQRLAAAATMLEHCEGIVMMPDVVALRPTPRAICCEVIDPIPDAHRCAEEFRVLIENASRALASSTLAARLPNRPLQWIVVDDRGTGAVKLWPES